MPLKFIPFLMIGLWGVILMPLPRANAATPLTRAEIQNLKNLVQLLPRNNKKRPARKLDPIIPGDGLSTGRSSLADLRFNDGSLARVGERAIFQFLPKTRNFRLSNGTVLLLIPPGKGQTRIQTPSAAAAIRGSALFVRYDQQTDTTIVGALTNSGIEVFNQAASQNQVLEAGQLMVIVKGEFRGLYDFDLKTFYETSDLVQGLNLTKQNSTSNPDPAIASVQAEIAAALATQTPVVGQGVIENPSFMELSVNSSNSVEQGAVLNDSPVNTLVQTGEAISDTTRNAGNNENVNTIIPNQPSNGIEPGNSIGRGNPGGNPVRNPGGNPGGMTPGGNPGGMTPGGNPGGGMTPGGNPGGMTPGGNPGGMTPGGNPGGMTPGGNPGGMTPGGNPGGMTPGGNPGGMTPGGNPGGMTPGDHPGEGGMNPGGNPGGGMTPGDHPGGGDMNPGDHPGGGDMNPGDHPGGGMTPGGNPGGGDMNPGDHPGGNSGGELPDSEYPAP